MGFFGTFVFNEGQWTEDSGSQPASEYLRIEIHDSDFAQVDYHPAAVEHGRFFLGFEPRAYFEDPEANRPVDREGEAAGFSAWVERVTGARVASDALLPLLAGPVGSDPDDVFVEETVLRLLRLAALPAPPALHQQD